MDGGFVQNKQIVDNGYSCASICCWEWLELLSRRGVVIMPDEFGPYWIEMLEQTDLNVLGIHPVAPEGGTAFEVAEAFMTEKEKTTTFWN